MERALFNLYLFRVIMIALKFKLHPIRVLLVVLPFKENRMRHINRPQQLGLVTVADALC